MRSSHSSHKNHIQQTGFSHDFRRPRHIKRHQRCKNKLAVSFPRLRRRRLRNPNSWNIAGWFPCNCSCDSSKKLESTHAKILVAERSFRCSRRDFGSSPLEHLWFRHNFPQDPWLFSLVSQSSPQPRLLIGD